MQAIFTTGSLNVATVSRERLNGAQMLDNFYYLGGNNYFETKWITFRTFLKPNNKTILLFYGID